MICPACKSESNKLILRQEENFIIFQCKSCNAIFSNILDNKIVNPEIGPPQHLNFYQIPRFLLNRYAFRSTAMWDISYLENKLDLSRIKTCLDIGAQFGFLVRELSKKGIKSLGLEAERYRGTVTKDMVYDFFGVSYDETKKYDLICLTNMLHYFSDSYVILKKCIRMLNDDGFLFITSNSADSSHIMDFVSRREYGPLLYLSKRNFETFCSENNLMLVDYSAFHSKLFLTSINMRLKIKIGFRLILYALGLLKPFEIDSNGERNYLIIKKNDISRKI